MFNIDITTEKITTNPPIRNIVDIELLMLSAKIFPRLLSVILLEELLLEICFLKFSEF